MSISDAASHDSCVIRMGLLLADLQAEAKGYADDPASEHATDVNALSVLLRQARAVLDRMGQ